MSQVFGRALHIGVNAIDAIHYPNYHDTLGGCENDAWFMAGIARYYGFSDIRVLLGPQATADAVLNEIAAAAADLPEGGYFLLTFAGHGGQVENQDRDDGEPYDQTWCLYDRQLLDDELKLKCWPLFRSKTRTLVIIDSCHSESSIQLPVMELFHRMDRLENSDRPTGRFRSLPKEVTVATQRKNRDQYTQIQQSLRDYADAKPGGSVMSISACADSEQTPDDGDYGRFTKTLSAVWNGGRFSGSHEEFYDAVYDAVYNSYGLHPGYCCPGYTDPGFRAAPAFKI